MNVITNSRAKVLYNIHISGRYFRLGLAFEARRIRPGQFFMLRVTGGLDPLLRRPLGAYKVLEGTGDEGGESFSGAGVEFLYEVVGRGTRMLSEREAGEEIDILGPLGNGFPLEEAGGEKKVIMVGGGMGIVPFYLTAKALNLKGGLLLFGGRGSAEAGLTEDFKGAGCDIRVSTDDGSVGKLGFVTDLLAGEITPGSVVYACGPPGMLRAVAGMAEGAGARSFVSLERTMACGIGVCLGCAVKTKGDKGNKPYKMVCSEGPVFDGALIDWSVFD